MIDRMVVYDVRKWCVLQSVIHILAALQLIKSLC